MLFKVCLIYILFKFITSTLFLVIFLNLNAVLYFLCINNTTVGLLTTAKMPASKSSSAITYLVMCETL